MNGNRTAPAEPASLDYWLTAFAGLAEQHDLPTDRPRPAVPDKVLARTEHTPEQRTRAAAAEFACSADVPVAAVHEAAVAALVHRLGAGTDIPLAVTDPGDGIGGEGPAVLRIDVSGRPSFRELVARVGARRAEARRNRAVPLEEVRDVVNRARLTPDRPLFQVGVSTTDTAPHPEAELWFGVGGEGPARLHYARRLFEPATAHRFLRNLDRLLTAALAEPDEPVHRLDILDEEQRHYLLHTVNDTARELPDTTFGAWFEEQVARAPDTVAIRCDQATWTYSELNARANRLARALAARGAGPEQVVAVLLPRSDQLIIAFLAVLKAGAVYMPADPGLPDARLRTMLADAVPALVVTDSATRHLVPEDVPAAARLEVDTDPEIDRQPDTAPQVAGFTGDSPVYLLYTSGSTGTPKGISMGAEGIVNLIAWNMRHLPAGPGHVTAHFAALGFDPTVQEFLGTLLAGGTLVVPPEELRRDPAEFVHWLREHGITDLYAPTVMIEAMYRAAVAQGVDLPELRQIAQGGEPLVLSETAKDFHAARPRRLYNLYGPTETHAATALLMPENVADWPANTPIGEAVWNTQLHVLDEDLALVPPGVPGELYIAGTCLARGYHRRPAQTADRFLPNPFGPPGSRMYRSGDVVRWRADSRLEFLGRTDHQLKIRGMRVELGEVEAAIRQTPQVLDAAVVAAGTGSRQRLDAYLVPAPGAADVVAATRALLARTVPSPMIPATFTLLDALPVNPNGKLDRLGLPAPHVVSSRLPESPQEHALCRIAEQVLQCGQVGVDDNFFELGGNSLLGSELAARVRTDLGLALGVDVILRRPTVAEWAESLTAAGEERPELRPVVPRPAGVRASYAQQNLWLVDQLEGPSPRYNEPFALRLTGRLDRRALEAALNDVVARHEALRTVLTVSAEGEPRQEVAGPAEARIGLLLSEVTEGGLRSALRETLGQPFDLAEDLPIRARLLRVTDAPDDETHVLLVVVHHVACDGASIAPFWRDLAAAFNLRTGRAEPAAAPAPLGVQYADYALWQRELLDPDRDPYTVVKRQCAYWTTALAGMPEVVGVPTDRARPEVRSVRGGAVPLSLPADAHARLAAFARSRRTTVFTVVHAAVTALLDRLGAGPDIVVGAVVAGRSDRILDDLVGFFANTVVLRVRTDGAPTFDALVERARETDLAAFAHQELPFEQVVDAVCPVRNLAHAPLVQVMLAFQVRPALPPVLAGLDTRFEKVDTGIAKFDLCFDVAETFGPDEAPTGLEGSVSFPLDIFDEPTVAGFTELLTRLLHETPGRSGETPDRLMDDASPSRPTDPAPGERRPTC
ncbi:amino acid adenylation domain-containing protein [Streptomyces olivaceus]|uniref:Amino acid adenylation domain-containing protein n=1 Tax=Streptomyces olivaceus TaxID=47716 RepID=A0ABS7WED5_STROV|nr:non-ribosomal peptide synthetase [Streptomyces olivaceus]MBZ6093488.1 amino acid adenylation domain-containing protein [Streptomyces olivaceus]MBZ6100421.1 amino acid adenylation domain-containing protein [Streptomyces olivaceus]MBZ6121585.1 amino acid adenylation domain-containing protein [Streptomyces olivaceus]MBZ6156321.1 amino acid adenylation domain-containing protein [Streptomyces olivaceus]MBZ6302847.1 amino acid adenylation domain-containing protein [Streptomyces olivaceus]